MWKTCYRATQFLQVVVNTSSIQSTPDNRKTRTVVSLQPGASCLLRVWAAAASLQQNVRLCAWQPAAAAAALSCPLTGPPPSHNNNDWVTEAGGEGAVPEQSLWSLVMLVPHFSVSYLPAGDGPASCTALRVLLTASGAASCCIHVLSDKIILPLVISRFLCSKTVFTF